MRHFSAFSMHDFVPKCEIQAVIGGEFFVVIMMVGGINPEFSEGTFSEEFRVNFNIEMIYETTESHKYQVKKQHIDIHRNDEK